MSTAILTDTPRKGQLRTNILKALVAAGEDGLTDYELSERFGNEHHALPTRRRDVELHGFCKKTGRHRLTKTKAPAIVHVVTPEGIAFARTGKLVPSRPKAGVGVRQLVDVDHVRDEKVIAQFVALSETTTGDRLRVSILGADRTLELKRGDEFYVIKQR